jgi:hypothetical protein
MERLGIEVGRSGEDRMEDGHALSRELQLSPAQKPLEEEFLFRMGLLMGGGVQSHEAFSSHIVPR